MIYKFSLIVKWDDKSVSSFTAVLDLLSNVGITGYAMREFKVVAEGGGAGLGNMTIMNTYGGGNGSNWIELLLPKESHAVLFKTAYRGTIANYEIIEGDWPESEFA